jgi:hypothetical protein
MDRKCAMNSFDLFLYKRLEKVPHLVMRLHCDDLSRRRRCLQSELLPLLCLRTM